VLPRALGRRRGDSRADLRIRIPARRTGGDRVAERRDDEPPHEAGLSWLDGAGGEVIANAKDKQTVVVPAGGVADELTAALEALRVAEEELREQNDALVAAQVELESERRRYEELFELAPIAYLVTDELGTIERANRSAEELLGAAASLVEGKPLAALVPPNARRELRTLLLELAGDGRVHELAIRLRPRGRDEIVVVARVSGVARGDIGRELRWSLEDVTERGRAETELRVLAAELEARVAERTEEVEAQHTRLAAIVQNVPIGLVLVEARTGRPETANDTALEIFGNAVDFAERQGYREDGSRYGPDDWPVVRSLRTGERVVGERAEVVRPDGSRLKVELSSTPIRNPRGRIVSAVSVVHDVTERERREVAQREFVANAAHELRTPLAAITGAIELLQSGAKDDPDARDVFLGHIERETGRLQRLVRAMLTLARAQTEAEAPRLEIVPLGPLLSQTVKALEPPPSVAVELECPPDLAAVANRDLLERVVANLAANAVQYTSEGRIVVRARADGDDVVELSVSDTGRGIAPPERERMFDRFYRGPRDRDGFGLGLAIVSEAVRAMDGTIDVESQDGAGTVVRVRLRAATVLAR
jgi:PAS domain S-box-containing protein